METRLKLFHLTSDEDGDGISREKQFHGSVLFTDRLLDETTDAIDNSLFFTYMVEEEIEKYEVKGSDHREWIVPAEVVNAYVRGVIFEYHPCNVEILKGESKLSGLHPDVCGLENCRHFGTEEIFIQRRDRVQHFCKCHASIGQYHARRKK